MKVQKQKTELPIENPDEISSDSKFRKHGILFGGKCKRGLFVGSSGCGKTNVVLGLLEHPNGVRFKNIYLYSKSVST